MLLYGASGHAKVIISILKANEEAISVVFDDDPTKTMISGVPVSGAYSPSILADEKIIVCIGDNLIRRKVCEQITHPFGQAIHPSALLDQSVTVGHGTVIMHRAVIQADTIIGNHVIINTMASVDHDCVVADFVHLAPGVVLCGNVRIGENTLVGVGSVVTPNLTIGRDCLITAGSVVTRDLPDGSVVRGNPGRIVGKRD